MSSLVPHEWSTIKIASIGDFYGGLTGKTAKDFGHGEFFLTYMQVFSEKTNNKEKANLVKIIQGEKHNKVKFGDILFTTSSETPDEIGMTTVFLEKDWTPYLNSFCFGLRPIVPSPLDPYFAKYLFRGTKFRKDMIPLAQGSTRFNLSKENLKKLNLTLPPLPEQKKIASILTSVDEVIENTQKQIDKLQDLKKAIMNELLTKGIGHTEFKDSELGRIPKSWEVKKFGSITSSIKSGLSRRLSSQDIGIPVINSGNLSPRGLNIDELKYWYIDDPQGANIKNYFLQEGDILLNFINSAAQIGKSCVFESIGRDCIYTTNLFRIRVGSSIISLFLHYLMTQERFRKEISLITKPAVNQASFTKDELENILVPTPPISEQDLILKSLSGIESQITAIYKKLSQTQSLKKSLMQDLLSGKVRVSVN